MKTNKIIKIFMAIVFLISFETSVIAVSTGVVNTDTVRVREKASTNSSIVALVSIGDKITITGEEGNWYKVKVDGEEGYIRKDLLTVDGKVTEEIPTENNNNNQVTSAENNNENSNGTTSKVDETNATTENPTQAENTNNTNEDVTGGETGATNASISIEKNDKTISTIKATGGLSVGKKVQLTEETKIKILPSANSSNIAKLKANTEVTVLEVINSWCRIETAEGACGWVRIDQ